MAARDPTLGLPPAITVHDREQAIAALTVARELGRKITLLSAPGAANTIGISWFLAMIGEAREAVPDAQFLSVFDCGRYAARAMVAVQSGVDGVVYLGSRATLLKLADIAEDRRVLVSDTRPKSLDLANERDPAGASLSWLTRSS